MEMLMKKKPGYSNTPQITWSMLKHVFETIGTMKKLVTNHQRSHISSSKLFSQNFQKFFFSPLVFFLLNFFYGFDSRLQLIQAIDLVANKS